MNNSIDYLDKIVNVLEVPYFKELGYYGIDDKVEKEYILCKVYGFEISIGNSGSTIYNLISGNTLYHETRSGNWSKSEYDENGKRIYYEDSNGYWFKFEDDCYGNEIYYENSYGQIIDNRNI